MFEIFTNPESWHWTAYLFLIPLAIFSIVVAKHSKYSKLNVAWSLPTLISAIGFQYYFWQTPHTAIDYALYAGGSLASMAFLLGVAFCTTNCLTACNGELCINRSSFGYALLSKLPLTMEGKSLCQVSWLGAILLLAWPVIVLAFSVLCLALSLIICLFSGQNPIKFTAKLLELGSFPEVRLKKSKSGLPSSLGIYAAPAIAIYYAVTCADWSKVWYFASWAMIFIGAIVTIGLLVAGITSGLYKLLGLDESVDVQTATTKEERILLEERNYVSGARTLGEQFEIYAYFWQIFKHKFCPKIRYVDCEDDE